MRQYILEHNSSRWQQTRLESKKARKLETAEIKQLVIYAKAQGSENVEKYYMALSRLILYNSKYCYKEILKYCLQQ